MDAAACCCKDGLLCVEEEMMDLSVDMPLEAALDNVWKMLARHFKKEETGLTTELIRKFWPEG